MQCFLGLFRLANGLSPQLTNPAGIVKCELAFFISCCCWRWRLGLAPRLAAAVAALMLSMAIIPAAALAAASAAAYAPATAWGMVLLAAITERLSRCCFSTWGN